MRKSWGKQNVEAQGGGIYLEYEIRAAEYQARVECPNEVLALTAYGERRHDQQ